MQKIKPPIPEPFATISAQLKHPRPVLRDLTGHRRAAVAMLLHRGTDGLQMLFIERATHPGDPWSGNIAFPGGKVESDDADSQGAAERETMEELGIDLSQTIYLGRLSDFDGAHMPVLLSCFVYAVIDEQPELTINEEVKDAFWVRLSDIIDQHRHGMHTFTFAGDLFESPCIRLPDPDKPVLWGLTYRLVQEFLKKTKEK
jgi:8-oxo-dGTP pyrophosphatase MutT (NUDIX family)